MGPQERRISCAYEFDRQLMITAVGEGWDTFAIENGAPELTSPHPIGRPLMMYVTDATTVLLYEQVFERITKTRRAVVLPVRCDGAALRRYLEVTFSPRPGGGFSAVSRLIRSEPRRPIALLTSDVPRTEQSVVMCGWCQRIDVDGHWVEVEDAVVMLGLFERDDQPQVSHGICADCHRLTLNRLSDDGDANLFSRV